MVVNKRDKKILCTDFGPGKRHDLRLFKESGVRFKKDTQTITDTDYQGIQKRHAQSKLPKKKTKKYPLTAQDKEMNRQIASERVVNENIIGLLKRFKIIADKYRNRRKRFGLRFNLIAGIYNYELT